MRIGKLLENDDIEEDEFEDMEISDALFALSEMAEDDKLTDKEIDIIEEMMDRLFDEEDDEPEELNESDSCSCKNNHRFDPSSKNIESMYGDEDQGQHMICPECGEPIECYDGEGALISEANIRDHADTKDERTATFRKTKTANRIRNRIYQRRYRRKSHVKMKAKKRAAATKRCKGKNRSVQLSRPGASTYVCKLKNRFRSKLMKRVAKRYRR